jgi:hypothetical protein
LLLNVPEKRTILRLIQKRYPGQDAIELVVGWVKELSATKIFGSKEPNVLGIGELDERHLAVFRGLLEGRTVAEINDREGTLPQYPTNGGTSVEDMANHLKALPLFKSMFSQEEREIISRSEVS